MWAGIKKALMYTVILSLFLAFYQLYGQPLYNTWIEGMGQSVGYLETVGGYVLAIMGALFARFMVWRLKGK